MHVKTLRPLILTCAMAAFAAIVLSELVVIASAQTGRAIRTAAVTQPSQCVMYGADNFGRFYSLNTATGAATLIGHLPFGSPTEIAFDPASRRALVQEGGFTFQGNEFDIATGAAIGPIIDEGANFAGLEWVGNVLYGTTMDTVGGPSKLRTLNPWTGANTIIGPTGQGPIAGLAYDTNTATMYGVTAGNGPKDLVTIDLATGAATIVGPLGITAGSLKFGSDGILYAGGARTQTGRLYTVNTATGAATLVGPVGFTDDVTGLMLVCTEPLTQASISGRVTTASGVGIARVKVVLTGGEAPMVFTTNSFGAYSFDSLATGRKYTVTPVTRKYAFTPQSRVIDLTNNVTNVDFTANG